MKQEYLKYIDGWMSQFAMRESASQGRQVTEAPCPMRTDYQRDRDRILHSKSFRRLKHKTQVFIAPDGDHFVTRMTHTLEVSLVARTISRALKLNEDLTEAIALGHDIGHTPFGHNGERVLAKILGHFEHNEQSLRVVDCLENEGKGLNLTYEVRDGILNHRSSGNPCTLEGKVVMLADKIAYINHDIDDAIMANIITPTDLPSEACQLLGNSKRERINNLIVDIINTSSQKGAVEQSPDFAYQLAVLRQFMFDKVYFNEAKMSQIKKAEVIVNLLYEHFIQHPEKLAPSNEPLQTRAADYIAGMTDNFAIRIFKDIYLLDTL